MASGMQEYCCSVGNACVRSNEWYYQCKPSLAAPGSAFAIAPSAATAVTAAAAGAGGGGATAAIIAAAGAAMTGAATSASPATTMAVTAAAAVTGAAALGAVATGAAQSDALTATAAAAMIQNTYDSLILQVPRTPFPARTAVTVAVLLTRQGQPVQGSTVQVTFTTTKMHILGQNGKPVVRTATVSGVTSASGRAAVTVPRRLMGVAGDVTFIGAVTEDARARGVRGTVVVNAEDVRVSWA